MTLPTFVFSKSDPKKKKHMHLPRPLPFVFSQSGARKEIVLYLQLNNTISFLAPDWLKTKGSGRGKCICFFFLGSDLLKTKVGRVMGLIHIICVILRCVTMHLSVLSI